ncbi:hypothetical protein ACSLGG_10870 [Bacillus mycoides]|uniref:hypothetical protein n=1 Tax=Bacillus mycoides TaxID=1405 RepID=UPI003F7543C2
MTGNLGLQQSSPGGTRKIYFVDDKGNEVFNFFNMGGATAMRDVTGAQDVWTYSSASKTFNLVAPNTNIVTKDKDSRATIPVSEDAELIGTNGVIADRRGNTVTIRAQVRRKAGSTIFTVPPGMRPLLMAIQNIVADDGTVGLLTVSSSGDVTLTSVGSTNVAGKTFSFTITYVVD